MHQVYISNDSILPERCNLKMECLSTINIPPQMNSFYWLNCNVIDWEKMALSLKESHIPTVAVSTELSLKEMQRAFLCGARAYCQPSIDYDTALAIIATVKRSGLWLPANFMSSVIGNLTRLPEYNPKTDAMLSLTERERKVANEILTGKSNSAISTVLGITERTVKEHISSILHKFSVKNRVGLLLKLGEFRKIN